MTRLIFVGPTPAPVQAPPAVGFDEVTKGYVPWSTSSRVPWPPSKSTTLPASMASFRISVVSATNGLICSAYWSMSSTTLPASMARRLKTLARSWFFCSSAASTFCSRIDSS